MLKLDHLTVIAPTLIEGALHVRHCLDLDVPFGTRHDYMGTHNHRLQLGNNVYLEIVALDPDGADPGRPRWFGLDNQASTDAIDFVISTRRAIFGDRVSLPTAIPTFYFAIPADGSLPHDGAAPSLIDHRGDPTSMASIPDLGARLRSLTLEHPDPAVIQALYHELCIDRPPAIITGRTVRYRAQIETPTGLKELT